MKKILILAAAFTLFLLCINFASANFGPLGTIVQVAGDLNYGEQAKNMTVYVYYNCTGIRYFNITFPPGFTLHYTGTPCGKQNDSYAECTFQNTSVGGLNQGSYTFEGSSTLTNYSVVELTTWLSNETDCALSHNVTIIRVPEEEIFHTLVEYGRGRGNYFYSTFGGGGTAGSGHTGTGCAYVPNNTMFELNFLHKMFNIRQYFDDYSLIAEDAIFTCSYPNRTIVRTHNGDTISRSSTGTNVSYHIDEIEGSWERMGYLGMDFDAGEQNVGDNLSISCKDVEYTLPGLGNVTVYLEGVSFDLQVRNSEPFIASASTTSTIGNGTQEVLITYNITNNELYTADSVIIEIGAPQYATFIGTRGELWGYALDYYKVEKTELLAGESEVIILAARFDTSGAPSMTDLNLTAGIKTKYITCWEANAYNPQEYIQSLYGIGTASVNMGASAAIISVMDRIEQIYSLVTYINTTATTVNSTANTIESLVNVINATTLDTNRIVKQINNTINNISSKTMQILNNTNEIINDTAEIKELIDCDNVSDTSMCDNLDDLNNLTIDIQNIIIAINTTLSNYSVDITVNLSEENLSMNITPDLANITLLIDDIRNELNCQNMTGEPNTSICMSLIRIENNTIEINNTVNDINNLIDYFNATVFGNITLSQIYDSLSNITVDVSGLLEEISKVRSFDEELIFLVTDAFGLVQEARTSAENGKLSDAAKMLRDANERLAQATQKLLDERDAGLETTAPDEGGSMWWVWVVLVGLMVVIAIYLFQRVPEEPQEQ